MRQGPPSTPPQSIRVEELPVPKIEIQPEFEDCVPTEFAQNPLEYFENKGVNIKSGETQFAEDGHVREDPTAVKDLPVWRNAAGVELRTVGKRVNTRKGAIGESGDPFYEYTILEQLEALKLPAARPVARAEHAGTHLIVMTRVLGTRWSEKESLQLKENGYSDDDIASLLTQAEEKMGELQQQFEAKGVMRSWKLKDMVFEIDVPNKRILSMTPTDWERTKIEKKAE